MLARDAGHPRGTSGSAPRTAERPVGGYPPTGRSAFSCGRYWD
ncbi:hypothetical protein APASM_2020 [Actinosynnema pretiosum subsp. pretiosum]|nr:hypothetical protein APASM_2020 [Actinosynnema pretiosum subsp. pretiosum]